MMKFIVILKCAGALKGELKEGKEGNVMLQGVKIFAFLISFGGYLFFVSRKVKISLYFAPILIIASISLFLYIGGLLNRLALNAYLTFAGGLLGALYFMVLAFQKKIAVPKWNIAEMCLLAGTALFGIVIYRLKLLHYDNFSHWALIVKYLLIEEHFPDLNTNMVVFLDYPPGTAVFLYYVCKFLGRSQGIMLLAQNSIIFSCFYAVFGIVKEKRRFLLYSFLGMGCAVLSYLNLTIRSNNLLVDFLLPLLVMASMAMAYRYRQRPGTVAVFSILVLGFTGIVKNTGIIFAGIGLAYYFWNLFHMKEKKKALSSKFFIALLTTIGILLPFLMWRYHMKVDLSGFESKFDFDVGQNTEQYLAAAPQYHRQIIRDFIKMSLNPSDRAAQIFFLGNILAAAAALIGKYYHFKCQNIWKLLIPVDLMTVFYYIGILFLYLYSMPEEEALRLAGFERYACSIMVLFAGCFIMGITVEIEESFAVEIDECGAYRAFASPASKRMYQYGVLFTFMIAVNFLYSEINGLISIRQEYHLSLPGKTEHITADRWPEDGKEDPNRYLIAAQDRDGQVASDEVRYVARYFLYAPQVEVTDQLTSEMLSELPERYDYLVVLDEEAVNLEEEDPQKTILKKPGIYSVSAL